MNAFGYILLGKIEKINKPVEGKKKETSNLNEPKSFFAKKFCVLSNRMTNSNANICFANEKKRFLFKLRFVQFGY